MIPSLRKLRYDDPFIKEIKPPSPSPLPLTPPPPPPPVSCASLTSTCLVPYPSFFLYPLTLPPHISTAPSILRFAHLNMLSTLAFFSFNPFTFLPIFPPPHHSLRSPGIPSCCNVRSLFCSSATLTPVPVAFCNIIALFNLISTVEKIDVSETSPWWLGNWSETAFHPKIRFRKEKIFGIRGREGGINRNPGETS